jgi:hypothetical protein
MLPAAMARSSGPAHLAGPLRSYGSSGKTCDALERRRGHGRAPARRWACRAGAQQELRPTTADGRYAVEEVVRAQFGVVLRAFGGLRRKRNELEYPVCPTEQASAAEAAEMLKTAAEIIDAASELVLQPWFLLTQ